jgi:hypothetical protein
VHYIDGIPTVIHSIRGAFAKAGVIQKDFTEKPCYLAKGKGFFAHGETVKEAATALEAKIAENKPIELRIERFVQKYPTIDSVAENKELFIWHHILTGSCEFGRREFAKKHDIDVEHGRMTVCRFIELTEEEYSGRIIALLKQKYEKSN